jgi:RecB family exonuclease
MPQYYSYSRINTFEACPRQYKFIYIEKAAVEKPVSVELFLGHAVHRTLEKLYRYKVNGRVQPEEEMLRDYHQFWEGPDRDKIKVTRENMAVDDYIKVGESALGKYYDMYQPFDEGEIIGLEKNINFPIDSKERFIIRAKLDKIVKRPDDIIEIVDYKTDSALPSQQRLDENFQMGLYQMAVRYIWPQFENITLKQVFLRHGVAMETTMPEDRIDSIRYVINQKILEIDHARIEDDFPPKESHLCDYCVYYELCPAKRHRLALEGDIEEEFDPADAKKLADRYLELYEEKKKIESEMGALKEDIVKFCEQTDLTRLDSDRGNVRVTLKEIEEFPSKSRDEKSFTELTMLARDARLDECFKLDQNVLYKEFFRTEKLPPDLMEKMRVYLRRRMQSVLRTSFKVKGDEED